MKNKIIICLTILCLAQDAIAQDITDYISKGNVIIHVFGNFDYNATRDAQQQGKFSIGRAHLGYAYKFNDKFSGKIVLDAGRPTTCETIEVYDSQGNKLDVVDNIKNGSHYTMTLKFASLEWQPNDNVIIQVGGILQNHYITQEKFWGYRYIAPTFQDKYYGIPSGDLGIISYFQINPKLSFDFAITNGEGFRSDQDAYGDFKMAIGLDYFPIEGLQTRFFYDYTKSEKPDNNTQQQLLSLFVGYKQENKFRVGVEYNYRKNHHLINNHDLFGYSIFGSYAVLKQLELFARFDQLRSNKSKGESHGWNYNNTGQAYISGVSYSPVKGINFSLNYQGWQPENNNLNFQHHILLSFEYKL